MRRAIVSWRAILSFSCTPSGAQSTGTGACAAPSPTPGRKKRVAIIDFDYATVHGSIAALFGQDVDVGKGISDLLVTYLVKDGTYSVIERKALDKIMAEQNFSNSDRANPTSAAKIGKLLGVDAIIVGSITQFGNETKNMNLGGAGGGLVGFGLGGFGHKKSKAIVAVTARMVDIDTGESWRCRRQRRIAARKHLVAGRRRQLARIRRRQCRLRQQRLPEAPSSAKP